MDSRRRGDGKSRYGHLAVLGRVKQADVDVLGLESAFLARPGMPKQSTTRRSRPRKTETTWQQQQQLCRGKQEGVGRRKIRMV